IRMLMLGSPPDMDAGAVVEAMNNVDGVRDVHHVHLWQMQEHEVALDCHVVLVGRDWSDLEVVKQEVKKKLANDFGITHSSLEFETSANAHRGASLFGHKDGAKSAGVEPGA
ncbi:MAG TPA: cation transporter, partial [Sulfitobacter sp.]|nr:cation transporter [Sulfitobacter sp.]